MASVPELRGKLRTGANRHQRFCPRSCCGIYPFLSWFGTQILDTQSVLYTWLALYKLDCAFNPHNPSHLTMSSVFEDALHKYGNQTSAEALFFHSSLHDYVKGLRVLLPDLGLEFSDNSYIGTGAFLTDLRRPDYLSILCYFDIVKIPPVFSTTMISKKPRGQINTSRIPLQIQEIINFALGSSFTIQMPQTQPKLSARYVIVSFTKNTFW